MVNYREPLQPRKAQLLREYRWHVSTDGRSAAIDPIINEAPHHLRRVGALVPMLDGCYHRLQTVRGNPQQRQNTKYSLCMCNVMYVRSTKCTFCCTFSVHALLRRLRVFFGASGCGARRSPARKLRRTSGTRSGPGACALGVQRRASWLFVKKPRSAPPSRAGPWNPHNFCFSLCCCCVIPVSRRRSSSEAFPLSGHVLRFKIQ